MNNGVPLVVGLAASVVAWYSVIFSLNAASAHVSRLMGMTGGDVAGPLVAALGGSLYALGLGFILFAATIRGFFASVALLAAAAASVLAEWMFASYVVDQSRFISPRYDSLPGPRPVQIADDATILWHIAAVTIAHVLLFIALTATVFLLTRALASTGSPTQSQDGSR